MESTSKVLRYLLAILTVVSVCQVVRAQTVLPSDAQARCAIGSGAFGAWFASGKVTANGIVKAPDNLTFSTGNRANCGFFERSGQMFLWLTSPPPSTYGGGSHVFNSPLFFQVVRDNDRRVLTPMTGNAPRILDLNLPQLGPGNIPFLFIFGNNGEIVTTTPPPSGPGLKPFADKKSGGAMEFEKQIATGLKPVFLDKDGRPLFLGKDGKLLDKDGTIFVGKDGKPIEVGQSNQAVLMARGNRLVYYMVQVNDVYAYFLTGAKNKVFNPPPKTFPASGSELEDIKQFAKSHTKPLLEPNVLTVTLKSAWVETGDFSPEERRKYITIEATVPDYDRSDNTKWVPKQPKTVELALIGMHVVFGLVGHPEKIWATFEHVNNTPHDTYFYLDDDENRKSVPRPTGGTWLFSSNSAALDVNRRQMGLRDGNIVIDPKADPPRTIRPSNLVRINAWGVQGDNNDPKNAARDNTNVISLNRSLIGQLHPDDVRRNYLLIGATWTAGNGVPPPKSPEGTTVSANTTMESFQQHLPDGCFRCHEGTESMLGLEGGRGGLSRIWGPLQPLFPPN